MASPTKSVRVFVSGANGQIGYSLLPLLANGHVFGPTARVHLQLLDVEPALPALRGVAMELEDLASPYLGGVSCTSSAEDALRGVDYAVFVGGFPRKQGMERKDLISVNAKIFREQGKALERVASKNVKVLVVANPANTNALILAQNAPSVPRENFTALTMLDLNRAKSLLAAKAGVPVEKLRRVAIFGNHSATQVPDAFNAVVAGTGKSAAALVNNDAYLKKDFIKTVQQRGKAIIDARKLSSALSAANAVADHLRAWVNGTADGDPVSMAVYTTKPHYGVKTGLVYSFPVTIDRSGNVSVVEDFKLDDDMRALLRATEKELEEERAEAFEAVAEAKL